MSGHSRVEKPHIRSSKMVDSPSNIQLVDIPIALVPLKVVNARKRVSDIPTCFD